jgi:hypothetical protein
MNQLARCDDCQEGNEPAILENEAVELEVYSNIRKLTSE